MSTDYIIINDEEAVFEIPMEVAMCAGCETQVTAHIEGWVECEESGLYKADSATLWCKTPVEVCNEMSRNLIQQDFMQQEFAALEWLNEQYRWKI
jgi:hypothetical protein